MSHRRRVLAALQFFPRGGSSHVARALALHLPAHRWDVTLVAGSRTDLGAFGDATRFYRGLDIHPVSFDEALSSPDPLRPPRGAAPMHPSYEHQADVPDQVFASLDDDAFERQVRAWASALSDAGAAAADVLHLHHLTPIHEAASRVAPHVPVIGHLHGTELLMLEEIADGPPRGWAHAQAWVRRMRAWAHGCEQLIVLSPSQIPRAERLLGIPADRLVVVSNGFDAEAFQRRDVDRPSLWHEALVEKPRGWLPGGAPGSVRYRADELEPLVTGVTVLSASRYTEVKRLPLLIEAFARARDRARTPAGLVIVGGHPGEWQGEHPADTVARLGVDGVFLAGWYEQVELSSFLSAADVFALASVREQFGQVLVEAMACGLPLVAVNRFGPGEIVTQGETGWLVEPDDLDGLAAALGEAIGDPVERRRRGNLGQHVAIERYGWAALARRVADVFDAAVATRPS
ncbi:MAG TPA: glycosyltransferase family 4 protein [Vitreimonas sp.]|nr:glycosyltransferase family 4 protein [Vitreimonas sp.]